MFAKLSALVGGGSTFAYNLGEPYSVAWGCWSHLSGTAKEDGSRVSIFKVTGHTGDTAVAAARHGVKKLRTVIGIFGNGSGGYTCLIGCWWLLIEQEVRHAG